MKIFTIIQLQIIKMMLTKIIITIRKLRKAKKTTHLKNKINLNKNRNKSHPKDMKFLIKTKLNKRN
jgi:hypothetical protein